MRTKIFATALLVGLAAAPAAMAQPSGSPSDQATNRDLAQAFLALLGGNDPSSYLTTAMTDWCTFRDNYAKSHPSLPTCANARSGNGYYDVDDAVRNYILSAQHDLMSGGGGKPKATADVAVAVAYNNSGPPPFTNPKLGRVIAKICHLLDKNDKDHDCPTLK